MDKEYARQLIEKYFKGALAPEEEYLLLQWYESEIKDAEAGQLSTTDIDVLRERMRYELKRRHSHKRMVVRYLAAASVLLALSVGSVVHFSSRTVPPGVVAEQIGPGGNRATLTLIDGETIDLSKQQAGIVVTDEITYLDGSKVIENDSKKSAKSVATGLLALCTPKGGTYSITLSDGTRVWLNSESTLRYPARFSDKERLVFLEGEAYFEVSNGHASAARLKDIGSGNWPFRVEIRGQRVEVLGTEFNVTAYEDEEEARTTLVSGKVWLTDDNKQSVILTPGEQAIRYESGFSVRKVDVQESIAWKDGYFYFNDTDLDKALKQFARWYGLEVSPDRKNKNELFSGKISRSIPLADAIAILEEISGRAISVDGTHVSVR
ncbi:FecR family protein [Parapedobacter sp. 2B3]|uniref:FecR family protein n=1 Tax=Parapedobacter sp. 2B3 TaxID=3342381 RepID=UPI0035B57434